MKKIKYSHALFILVILFTGIILFNIFSVNNDAQFLYDKGLENYNHNYALSEKYFLNSILIDDTFEKSYLMLFHYYFVLVGDTQEATIIIDKYIDKFPQNETGYSLKSILLINENKTTQAGAELSKIKQKDEHFNDITLLSYGLLNFEQSNFLEGYKYFNKSLHTKNVIIMDGGLSYFRIEKIDMILSKLIEHRKYDLAKNLILKILDKPSSFNTGSLQKGDPIKLNRYLAQIYMEQGNYSKAKNILIDLEKKYEATDEQGLECPYQALGLLFYKTNDLNKSLEYYKKYANVAPFRVSAQLDVAKSCMMIEKIECAKEYVDKALTLDETNSEAHNLYKQLQNFKS